MEPADGLCQGISLSLEQYKALLRVLPELNASLQAEGHSVGSVPPAAAGEEVAGPSGKSAKEKKSTKSNIDATSDEDEGDGEGGDE